MNFEEWSGTHHQALVKCYSDYCRKMEDWEMKTSCFEDFQKQAYKQFKEHYGNKDQM